MSCNLLSGLSTIRATLVDECGEPIPGPENAMVVDCLSSLAMNPNVDVQDDIIYRAANGNLCGVKRGCPSLLGYDIELNVYTWSPELLKILTGNPEVLNGTGDVVGIDDCAISCDAGFGLEFWIELIQPCPATGNKQYLYGVLPWVTNAYLTDLEIGSEAVTFQLSGNTRAGGQWGTGPFNVIDTGIPPVVTPAPMLTPLGATCHRRLQLTTLAPPVAACEPITVPAPAP